ncbi:pyroglutamyl-peptidase I, partial [Streptococcus salivarius]|nr:pyroglutamyl-peptidase I [Streptococcus salivarius]
EGKGRRGGFIHVPYLPKQAARLKNEPSMSLEMIVEGLTLAIKASVEIGVDERMTDGVEC